VSYFLAAALGEDSSGKGGRVFLLLDNLHCNGREPGEPENHFIATPPFLAGVSFHKKKISNRFRADSDVAPMSEFNAGKKKDKCVTTYNKT
jgi:hypothetical protein